MLLFERYVNFDFYKTFHSLFPTRCKFERYVNFDFYKTHPLLAKLGLGLRDM